MASHSDVFIVSNFDLGMTLTSTWSWPYSKDILYHVCWKVVHRYMHSSQQLKWPLTFEVTLTSRSQNQCPCSTHVLILVWWKSVHGEGTEAKTWYHLHSGVTLTSRSCIPKVTEWVAVLYTCTEPSLEKIGLMVRAQWQKTTTKTYMTFDLWMTLTSSSYNKWT